jgi:hypothetical protein
MTISSGDHVYITTILGDLVEKVALFFKTNVITNFFA